MLSIRNTHTHTHADIVRRTCIEIEKDFWANDEVILWAATRLEIWPKSLVVRRLFWLFLRLLRRLTD